MKKANMGRIIVWSLCFGVAVTASSAASGLTDGEHHPTNPALRLAVEGQADPFGKDPTPSLRAMTVAAQPDGYSASFRRAPVRLAPERLEPVAAFSSETAFTGDYHRVGPEARTFNLEYTISAPASVTGLNLDLAIAPRAGVALGPEGGQVRSVGGEVRLGRRLENMVGKFDSNTATWDRPSWYFFAATDGSALTWTPEAMAAGAARGLNYQEDRIIVGDAQIGISMEANGMQASLGFTNREISNGQESVDENFIGASFAMRR
ncbi:MAG: hypothetical protein NW200_09810 [Hyphomonadaceae bacterium]|nr:hypothetical protein [Hyphomonadaceae bacterium]